MKDIWYRIPIKVIDVEKLEEYELINKQPPEEEYMYSYIDVRLDSISCIKPYYSDSTSKPSATIIYLSCGEYFIIEILPEDFKRIINYSVINIEPNDNN